MKRADPRELLAQWRQAVEVGDGDQVVAFYGRNWNIEKRLSRADAMLDQFLREGKEHTESEQVMIEQYKALLDLQVQMGDFFRAAPEFLQEQIRAAIVEDRFDAE